MKNLYGSTEKTQRTQSNNSAKFSVSLVCLFTFFEIVFKVIDLLFYLTDNSGQCHRSFEPVTEFTMSVR
jgi:hypothetical protein